MLFPIPAVMELIESHFRHLCLGGIRKSHGKDYGSQSSSPAVVAVTTSSPHGPEHDGTMFSFSIDSATSPVAALPQAENLSPC